MSAFKTLATIGFSALTVSTGTLLGSWEAAQAAALDGPLNNLQGINELQIGDTIYDIRFRPGGFNSTFDNPAGAKPLPTFLNNEAGATAAVNAINAFFNSVNFGDVAGNGILGNVSTQYLIPFLADIAQNGNVTSKVGVYSGGNWTLGSSDLIHARNASQTPSYVEFINARAIPTPALLPGVIGVGLGLLRKRQQLAKSEGH